MRDVYRNIGVGGYVALLLVLATGCKKPEEPDPRSKDPVRLAIHGAPGS